jgi:hypothetical protein
MRRPLPPPPVRYRYPLTSSMATLWVASVPLPVMVFSRLTTPVSTAERSMTWIPWPPSLTE